MLLLSSSMSLSTGSILIHCGLRYVSSLFSRRTHSCLPLLHNKKGQADRIFSLIWRWRGGRCQRAGPQSYNRCWKPVRMCLPDHPSFLWSKPVSKVSVPGRRVPSECLRLRPASRMSVPPPDRDVYIYDISAWGDGTLFSGIQEVLFCFFSLCFPTDKFKWQFLHKGELLLIIW